MNPEKFKKYFSKSNSLENEDDDLVLELADNDKGGQIRHSHRVVLTRNQVKSLQYGQTIEINSEQEQGHDHMLQLR